MILLKFDGINGQLIIEEDRLIILRKGALALLTQGLKGSKTIPFTAIRSIQYKEGGPFLNGYIQIGLSGGIESVKGVFDATKDENTVMFRQNQNHEALKAKEHLEQKILERDSNSNRSTFSVADEIKKFKDLLDSGIISQEEFNLKKKQLLGSM